MEQQFNNALSWVTAKASEAYKYSLLIVAAGSTLVIYQWVIGKATELGVPFLLSGLIALIGANVWYMCVEHTLKVVMPFSWAYLITKGDKVKSADLTDGMKKAGKSAVFITVLLATATVLLSVITNYEIVESITVEKDSNTEIESSRAVSDSYDASRETLEKAVAVAKATDAKALKDAEDQAKLLVTNAAKIKGEVMFDLWNKEHNPEKPNYNKWCRAESRLGRPIRIAREKGEKLLATARASNQEVIANNRLQEYIAKSSAIRDSVSIATAGLLTSRNNQYLNKVSRRNNILFLAVVAAFLVAVFSCRLMVIGRLEREEEIIDDESPGVFKTAKSALSTANKKLAEKLADKWDVKFVSVPVGTSVIKTASIAAKKTSPAPVSLPVSGVSASSSLPVSTPSVLPPSKTGDKVSVSWSKTDRSVSVEINGKTYTAVQAQDRVRKFYSRSNTAATQKARTDNAAKYETMKEAMLPYFNFTERKKNVSVKLK